MKFFLPEVDASKYSAIVHSLLTDLQHMYFDTDGEDQDVNGADCVDKVGELLSAMGLRPKPVTDTLVDAAKAIIIYTATMAPEGIFTVPPIDENNALIEDLVDEGYMEYEHRDPRPGIHLRLTELGLEAFDCIMPPKSEESMRHMNQRLLQALKEEHGCAHDDNGGRPHCPICGLIADAEEIR